jgi:hypothetical protein
MANMPALVTDLGVVPSGAMAVLDPSDPVMDDMMAVPQVFDMGMLNAPTLDDPMDRVAAGLGERTAATPRRDRGGRHAGVRGNDRGTCENREASQSQQ